MIKFSPKKRRRRYTFYSRLLNYKHCIDRILKRKAAAEEEEEIELEMAHEIKALKKEAQILVLDNRDEEMKRIKKMQRKNQRKLRGKKQKIEDVRMVMAAQVEKAERIGDAEVCKPTVEAEAKEDYCNKFYIDDMEENLACKAADSFCYMCCDNEFGEFHTDKRTECFNMCEDEYEALNAPLIVSEENDNELD